MVKDYRALARHNARKVINAALFSSLVRDGLREDYEQELSALALEAERMGMGLQDASRFIQRGIYRFLTAYGYRRERGYGGYKRREVPIDEGEELVL